jgi:hypothetical protein
MPTRLTRKQTLMQPQRGISTSGGRVVALQVQFRGGPYPDRLLPNASIEHIGEGREGRQLPKRGNKAMLLAAEVRSSIPVYSKVGVNAYEFLGNYVVISHRYECLNRATGWHGYVFTLRPL